MLDEAEFARIDQVYRECTAAVQQYRQDHSAPLSQTPVDGLFRPVRQEYVRLTGRTSDHQDEILRHRIALYGPSCHVCGKPLRTPAARVCAACGSSRADPPETPEQEAARMLEQIGWNAASLKQIEVYARMKPAAKIEQMFRLRRAQMDAMIARIRKEQPDLSREELAAIVQERLRWARDEDA
jgi:hypothetical protein